MTGRRYLVCFAATLWMLTGLTLVAPGLAGATFPGKNGKIAFAKHAFVRSEASIYTMNPDGSEITKLPDTDVENLEPRWSPDGRKIAFTANHSDFYGGKAEIWTMNADGMGRTRLTDNAMDDRSPTWSPDGTRIAFTRYVPNVGSTLYVMNSDGTSQTALPGEVHGTNPTWSPDGKRIAYLTRPGYHELPLIAVVPADGSRAPMILPRAAVDVSWSPDGTKFAFTNVPVFEYWPGTILVANFDGSGATNISPQTSYPDGPLTDGGPVWSPDGDKIAFTGCEPCIFDTGVSDQISTMKPDGTGRTVIAPAYAMLRGNLDWQPIPGPNPADYRNAPAFCRAEEDFFGSAKFLTRYGGGFNAFGKCVSLAAKKKP